MKYSLTITADTFAELVEMLGYRAASPLQLPQIDHLDNPSTGTPSATEVFGAAPSTVAVAPPPTVPAAPLVTGTAPTSAPSQAVLPLAPAAPAPTAPAAPPSLADSVDVDVTGLPWDERIHAQNKAKNGDGSWRQKRGLNDPSLKAKIEAELRGTEPPAPAPVIVPAAVLAPPPAPPLPPPTGPVAWTFDRLLTAIVKAQGAHTVTKDQVDAALQGVGVTAFGQLAGLLQVDLSAGDKIAAVLGLAG